MEKAWRSPIIRIRRIGVGWWFLPLFGISMVLCIIFCIEIHIIEWTHCCMAYGSSFQRARQGHFLFHIKYGYFMEKDMTNFSKMGTLCLAWCYQLLLYHSRWFDSFCCQYVHGSTSFDSFRSYIIESRWMSHKNKLDRGTRLLSLYCYRWRAGFSSDGNTYFASLWTLGF